MNIVEIIQNEVSDFAGICVREGYISPDKVREFGISMAWTFNKYRAQRCQKVLIAGYGEQKRKYFIADITNIMSVREAYMLGKWTEAIEYNNDLHGGWIEYHLNSNKPNNPIDDRFVIVFENPTEIRYFSTNFVYARGSFYYIQPKSQHDIPYTPLMDNAPLSHIKELYIKGFKDPEREVNLSFCEGAITIIHGENGSGKTTLLKVIQAILKKDISFLTKERVEEFKITFLQGQEERILSVNCKNIGEMGYDSDMIEIYELIEKYSRSSFFGVYRGVEDNIENIRTKLVEMRQMQAPLQGKAAEILDQLLQDIPHKNDILSETSLAENHIAIEKLGIAVVEEALCRAFDNGQKAILRGMNRAFFETIDNFLTMEGQEIIIPPSFEADFKDKKVFFQSFLRELKPSASQEKLKTFVDAENISSIDKEKPLFKALIINLLNQTMADEKENIELNAIYEVINTFNTFLMGKKLTLDAYEAKISISEIHTHTLANLSSGELHLLSFLTLFLIIRRNDNVFLIDEPEISLSMAWQRKLLPLLTKFAPHAQIIVATHSPEMANGHTEYLRKLS